MFHTLNKCNHFTRNFAASQGIANTYSPHKRLNFNNCCAQRPYSVVADFIQHVVPTLNLLPSLTYKSIKDMTPFIPIKYTIPATLPHTICELEDSIPSNSIENTGIYNTYIKEYFKESGFISFTIAASTLAYTIYNDKSKRLERDMNKLNDLFKQLNELEQNIKKSYQESYTIIRPEDRATASKIKDLSTQFKFIIVEIEDSITRLETYKFKKLRNFQKNIELAKYKKSEVESYYYIAESIFQCEINNYGDASRSIIKALKKYTEAIHNHSKQNIEEKFKNIELYLNSKLVDKKELSLEEEGSFLKEITDEVSKLYKKNDNFNIWYSDILTYISYVLFDSYNRNQKISPSGLIPTFFSTTATKVNPNNYIAYNNACFQYGHLGHPDIAQHYIDQSIEKDSLCTISHYNKGLLLFLAVQNLTGKDLADKYKEAKQALTIAAKTIDPHYNYEKEKNLIPATKAITQVNKPLSSFPAKALSHLSHLKKQNIHRVKHKKLHSRLFTIEKIIKQINVAVVSIPNPDKSENTLEAETITQANLSFLQTITASLQEIEACEKGKPLGSSNNHFNRKDTAVVHTEILDAALREYENYFINQAEAQYLQKWIINVGAEERYGF